MDSRLLHQLPVRFGIASAAGGHRVSISHPPFSTLSSFRSVTGGGGGASGLPAVADKRLRLVEVAGQDLNTAQSEEGGEPPPGRADEAN